MNWPVLKDKKWWIYLGISMVLYVITIILAAFENEYWIAILVLALIITTLGGRRGIYLTHEVKEKGE
ncbi:hypothetical protein [Virgibacillus sp. CBA3643]|uniref:hypothetical protein n=1 Tax=Virgibacillus sp. CBA3643 TaxID=2942278 RepID=UPI0035A2AC46